MPKWCGEKVWPTYPVDTPNDTTCGELTRGGVALGSRMWRKVWRYPLGYTLGSCAYGELNEV